MKRSLPISLLLLSALFVGILLHDSPQREDDANNGESIDANSSPARPSLAPTNSETPVFSGEEEESGFFASLSSSADYSIPENPAPELSEFHQWTKDWTRDHTKNSVSDHLAKDGVRLAKQRRDYLYRLAEENPKAFLAAALPDDLRQELPTEVQEIIERPVVGTGDVHLSIFAPIDPSRFPNGTEMVTAHVGGEIFEVSLTEDQFLDETQREVPINGVAIDDRLVLRETSETGLTLAKLSKKSGSVEKNAANNDPVTPTFTVGQKNVLVVRIDFTDRPGTPELPDGTEITETYAADLINTEVNSFFDETSYGLTSLTTTEFDVTPVYTMPDTAAEYAENDSVFKLLFDAQSAAEDDDYSVVAYDRRIIVFSDISDLDENSFWWTSFAPSVPGWECLINGQFDLATLVRALGYTYRARNANWKKPPAGSSDPLDPLSTSEEAGDPFDGMGSGAGAGHPLHAAAYNPRVLNHIGWLPDGAVKTVSETGTYRLYRFDHRNADLTMDRALKIERDTAFNYWIGYRRKYVGHPTLSDISEGAYIVSSNPFRSSITDLIDFDTPGSDPTDASLNVGDTFDDTDSGVTIEVLGEGGTGVDEWIDVKITLSPRISLTRTVFQGEESTGKAVVTLQREGSATGAISVNWTTVDGTAESPADYASPGGTVAWADGDMEPKSIEISLVEDGVDEEMESFFVDFSGISGGSFAGFTSATVQIVPPGYPDGSFLHPRTDSALSGPRQTIRDFVAQPDGNITAVGAVTFFDFEYVGGTVRFCPDGEKDEGFSQFDNEADSLSIAIARQPGGKLIVGGFFQTFRGQEINQIARLNPDGSLDETFFSGDGAVHLFGEELVPGQIQDIAVQPDGKILVGGYFVSFHGETRRALVRLNSDGTLDTDFYASLPPGFQTAIVVERIVLQPDGKILIGGKLELEGDGTPFQQSGLWRLNPDGSYDSSFDTGLGAGKNGDPNQSKKVFGIALQPDGKIIAGGNFDLWDGVPRARIVRLNSNGSVDESFSTTVGVDPGEWVNTIACQPDGKILLGGIFNQINGNLINYAARLHSDGTFDSSFDAEIFENLAFSNIPNGVWNMGMLPDGKIAIAQDNTGVGQVSLAKVHSGLPGLAGTVQFTEVSREWDDSSADVSFTVSRTGGSTGAISVSYATVDGRGTAGVDYTATSGFLEWADGDGTDKTFTVPVSGDGPLGTGDLFTVQLGTPIGGTSVGLPEIVGVTTSRVSPRSTSITYASQSYSISIRSGSPWTASSDQAWAVPNTLSGTGATNDMIMIDVEQNPTHDERVAIITIDGIEHTLTQEGAPPTELDLTSKSVSCDAQSYNIAVTAFVDWTVSEKPDWVTVNPSSGSGSATVEVSVTANLSHDPRPGAGMEATIVIDGVTHTITQQGAPRASHSPGTSGNLDHTEHEYEIDVTAKLGWTAIPSHSWIQVDPASGAGDGTIMVTVASNPTFDQRSGTINIDGTNHNISQNGIPVITTFVPASGGPVPHAGDDYTITVTSNGPWTASSNQSWLGVTPLLGNGNGEVTVTVDPNESATSRNGVVTIGGQQRSFTQNGAPSFVTLDRTSETVAGAGDSFNIDVTSNDSWTVTGDPPWVSSILPSSGTGDRLISITVSANDSINERVATIHIGGQPFTITQSGGSIVSIVPGSGYLQDFASTLPGIQGGWGFRSDEEGQIELNVSNQDLRLDDTTDNGTSSLNEAILQFDLRGQNNVILKFRHRHANDELDQMPETFTDSVNADGVAISEDGVQWFRIVDFADRSADWKDYEVDLFAAATAAGLTFTDSFQIKFQQYGSMSWPEDGYEFDDISVGPATVPQTFRSPPPPGIPSLGIGEKSGGPFKSGTFKMKNSLPKSSTVFARIQNLSSGADTFTLSGPKPDKSMKVKIIQIGGGNITGSVMKGGYSATIPGTGSMVVKITVKPKDRSGRSVKQKMKLSASAAATSNGSVKFIWKKKR